MGYIFIIKCDGFLISQKTTFREGIKIDKNVQLFKWAGRTLFISRTMIKSWSDGIHALKSDRLEKLGYFDAIQRIKKIKKSSRLILERDLNELFLNYLMANHKAAVVMSGSLVETLLIYHCEKRKIKQITYDRNQRQISKRLYDADLGDLLDFFEQNKILRDLFVHIGNIAIISRNFIHPGKELREVEPLNQAKADICFISALEVVRHIYASA